MIIDPRSRPRVGQRVYISPTAWVGGEVSIGDDTTIMHYACIRGDVSAITIGARVNVQDAVVIHTHSGVPLDIGDDVSIGHQAVVHCRRVGDRALIGIRATVLDDAEIGTGAIVAAAALVPPRMVVPAGKLVMGVPARIVRDVTDAERRYIEEVVSSYRELGRAYAADGFAPVRG
jgi:carbonic anhydrase/acetyltransferase-like protein (isoleucine patch superfamily)